MDNRTLLNIINIAIGLLSLFLVSEQLGILKVSNNFHYWLSGCYTGVVAFGLILFIVSKVQQRSKNSKDFRENL